MHSTRNHDGTSGETANPYGPANISHSAHCYALGLRSSGKTSAPGQWAGSILGTSIAVTLPKSYITGHGGSEILNVPHLRVSKRLTPLRRSMDPRDGWIATKVKCLPGVDSQNVGRLRNFEQALTTAFIAGV